MAPELLSAWTSPTLGAPDPAGPARVHPIEVLAARLRAAARARGGQRGLAWLDCGGPACGSGSESVLTAFPTETRRWDPNSPQRLESFLDGLAPGERAEDSHPALSFRGGWIGFLCYEAVEALEPVRLQAARDLEVPLASWARHPVWFRYVPDRSRLELWRTSGAMPDPPLEAWRHWAEEALRSPYDATVPLAGLPPVLSVRERAGGDRGRALVDGADRSLPRARFESAVRGIQAAIAEGETFQANLAQRLTLEGEVDPFAVYIQVRRLNPSPFACFIEEEWGALVSNSPERLFAVRAGGSGMTVHARPIAGTRPRTGAPSVDEARRRELLASEKERAEHTMLVDLARNDLGRVCEPGSVRVTAFQTVQEYSHVLHLVSDVEGALRAGTRFSDVVRALFPGGTITGAPKLRSIEVIDGAEPVMRGPYTGSAGYVNPDGTADLNILIRTLVHVDGRAHVYAGAGIVADSDAALEYEETLHKAGALLEAWQMAREDPARAMERWAEA